MSHTTAGNVHDFSKVAEDDIDVSMNTGEVHDYAVIAKDVNDFSMDVGFVHNLGILWLCLHNRC